MLYVLLLASILTVSSSHVCADSFAICLSASLHLRVYASRVVFYIAILFCTFLPTVQMSQREFPVDDSYTPPGIEPRPSDRFVYGQTGLCLCRFKLNLIVY